jgi:hypothetical protein
MAKTGLVQPGTGHDGGCPSVDESSERVPPVVVGGAAAPDAECATHAVNELFHSVARLVGCGFSQCGGFTGARGRTSPVGGLIEHLVERRNEDLKREVAPAFERIRRLAGPPRPVRVDEGHVFERLSPPAAPDSVRELRQVVSDTAGQ